MVAGGGAGVAALGAGGAVVGGAAALGATDGGGELGVGTAVGAAPLTCCCSSLVWSCFITKRQGSAEEAKRLAFKGAPRPWWICSDLAIPYEYYWRDKQREATHLCGGVDERHHSRLAVLFRAERRSRARCL